MAMDAALAALRAAGEATRLRVLALLRESELSVKDLTAILGQSQPRISRHLKLLADAGLIDRYPEGAWVFYRLTEETALSRLVDALLDSVDGGDPVLSLDRERLADIKREHAEAATAYFATNAGEWDTIRALHVTEDAVEDAILGAVGDRPFESLLDLGTGTGRMLELLHALYNRATGIDTSPNMLAVARANLDQAGIVNAQVRLGDIYNLALPRNAFDLITVHQVLHYLDEPDRALAEAARVLRPGGRLLIVDFAPHDLEFLREDHAHRRLGFGQAQVKEWIRSAGLVFNDSVQLPGGAGKLTVTLWLARDARTLVADSVTGREVA